MLKDKHLSICLPRSASTVPTSSRPTPQTLSKTSPRLGGDHLRREPDKDVFTVGGDHHCQVSLKDRELGIVGEVGAKIRVLDFISPDVRVSYFSARFFFLKILCKFQILLSPPSRIFSHGEFMSECDGLEVVRNPKRPIGAWIHYYNDQLAMMKEKDKEVKINDDVRIEEKIGQEVECTFKSRKRKFHGKVQRKFKTIFTPKGCGSKGNFYFYIFRLDAPPSELLELLKI
ncbi:hypothetical protein AAG906_012462 [Vitis piasezkii]